MPTHWTYISAEENDDLHQGDILQRSGELLEIFESVHKHFLDDKYTHFIVVTQTCDLVRRHSRCKTRHLTIAVVRPLKAVLSRIIPERLSTPHPQLFLSDHKGEVNELVERIINQNEQAHGLFYLHPDQDVTIAESSVALLRVTISLRAADHYSAIVRSRVGRLSPSFKNKLGWLAGNLFSRVDTPDWSDYTVGKDVEKLVDRLLNATTGSYALRWVDRRTIENATKSNFAFSELPVEKALESLKAFTPQSARDAAILRFAEVAAATLDKPPLPELQEAIAGLKFDPVLESLSESQSQRELPIAILPPVFVNALVSHFQSQLPRSLTLATMENWLRETKVIIPDTASDTVHEIRLIEPIIRYLLAYFQTFSLSTLSHRVVARAKNDRDLLKIFAPIAESIL